MKTSPVDIGDLLQKKIWQIIAIIGDGKLADGSETSKQFRRFLADVPTQRLAMFADQCVSDKLDKSHRDACASALQDIVNEIGRRLGFSVENGRYQGVRGESGHDGLWKTPDAKHAFIIEVRTKGAFLLNKKTIEGYKDKLLDLGKIKKNAFSVLLVYGSGDRETLVSNVDEKTTQVVSLEELFRLLGKMEQAAQKNAQLFHEFLKPTPPLGSILDALDALPSRRHAVVEKPEPAGKSQDAKAAEFAGPAHKPDEKDYAYCVGKASKVLGRSFLKVDKRLYASEDGGHGLICLVSKPYDGGKRFWWSLLEAQYDKLKGYGKAHIVLGCGSMSKALMIEIGYFDEIKDGISLTEFGDTFKWQIVVYAKGGKMLLGTKRGLQNIDVTDKLIAG